MTSPPPLPSESSRPSVFLSYASADREAARALRASFEAAGLDVWLDEEELAGGEAWDAKIRLQIRTCTYFVAVISATTEARREGYFRREWRLAVERTLDLADDVTFLIPIVIDETRETGARVPEKFLTVQWLRVPNGQETSALRDLARRLAIGDSTPSRPVVASPLLKPGRTRTAAPASSGFPPFPPYPEKGHRARFTYDLVLWSGRTGYALWSRIPRFLRIVVIIFMVFQAFSWVSRGSKSPRKPAEKPVDSEISSSVAKALDLTALPGAGSLEKLVGAASEALQLGRPLVLVPFTGESDAAKRYAKETFTALVQQLQLPLAEGRIAFSAIPLAPGFTSDDALARGLRTESKHVLVGQARVKDDAITLVVTLYHVPSREAVWSRDFDSTGTPADRVGNELSAALLPVLQREPAATR